MFYLKSLPRFRFISDNQQILSLLHGGRVYFLSSFQTTCRSSALNRSHHILQRTSSRSPTSPRSPTSSRSPTSPRAPTSSTSSISSISLTSSTSPTSVTSSIYPTSSTFSTSSRSLTSQINQIRPGACRRCYSSQPSSTEDGVLIYTGNLGKAVLGVKFFSYSSSMFSLCVMPVVLMKTGIGVSGLAMKAAFCGFIGFFTFLTPVLLHLITKGYVVRLYHNPETDMYTAVTYSALLVEKKTVFHQNDVRVPDVSRMFTSFYAKKKSMLINPTLFQIPHDYNHLMGYDRPFSFNPDDINKPDNN